MAGELRGQQTGRKGRLLEATKRGRVVLESNQAGKGSSWEKSGWAKGLWAASRPETKRRARGGLLEGWE